MTKLLSLVCAGCLWTTAAWAQAKVTVTIHGDSQSAPIPDDFVGLSFGMKALLPDGDGNHFLSGTNQPLVQLFENLGIRHLRLGGTSVESPPQTPIPNHADIDSVFSLVQAAHIRKVIYSLRLLE